MLFNFFLKSTKFMKRVFFIVFVQSAIFSSKSLGAEEGMPQLNPEFWFSQTFWLVLVSLGQSSGHQGLFVSWPTGVNGRYGATMPVPGRQEILAKWILPFSTSFH